MNNLTKFFVAAFAMLVFFNACKDDDDTMKTTSADEYTSEVVTEWMGLQLKLTKEGPGFSPPVAARAFGYAGLTLYESVRPGMPGYKSLAGQVNGLASGSIPEPEVGKEYHWGIVANSAVATVVRACYNNSTADNLTAINALETKYNITVFGPETTTEVSDRSVAYGKSVGDAMVAYANSDGQAACYASNFPASYVPPVGEGLWVPTPPAFQSALQPYWGTVRPFLVENVAGTLPPPPPAYSTDPSSAFWEETMEVYDAVNDLTPEQIAIAEYWSDDPGSTATPPGHSISILKQVLENENTSLAFAAEAYAKMGMGVHDAFVSCWHAKFTYNLVRPITVIHAEIDPSFAIPLNTPPFPEYTSGHSVQSGAAAQILADLFGDNYTFTDRTHEGRTDIDGSPRSYSSFSEFADEAAISRLYGGIHYRAAIELGVTQGKEVGTNIGALDFN